MGDCVPFYFCPRSVMLYVISRSNHPELEYLGGQTPIVHLEADLQATVAWADTNGRRWAFTSSNAGSYYFEDFSDLRRLDKISWDAVDANQWSGAGVDQSVKEASKPSSSSKARSRGTWSPGLASDHETYMLESKTRFREQFTARR